MEHYIGSQIVILMIYIIIGGAIILQIKNIDGFYKFAIFIILLNLVLTIFTPNMSLFNLFSYDNIEFNVQGKDYWSIRGQIGDLLSGHFTALAFIGLMLTISQMNKALTQQDEAISIQKEEMNKQFEEIEKQSFENKFFQMLNLFHNVINNLYLSEKLLTGKGSGTFTTVEYPKQKAFEQLRKKLFLYIIYKDPEEGYLIRHTNKITTLDEFQIIFNQFNNKYDTTFKYYFINLYQIIKYVDNKYKNDFTKATEYTNIIRAQLSKNELVLLFYNAYMVDEFSGEKYRLLVEKYSFFEHLRYKDLEYDNENNSLIDLLIEKYINNPFGKNEELSKKWIELHK